MANITVDKVVDCKGLSCPMPVMKAKKAIKEASAGQVVEIIATDPGSKSDIPALVRNMGAEMIEARADQSGALSFFIRKD